MARNTVFDVVGDHAFEDRPDRVAQAQECPRLSDTDLISCGGSATPLAMKKRSTKNRMTAPLSAS
jgi:hypothetical protein